MNSLRSLGRAIEYEIERQIGALESGERIVQETRHWDEADGRTHSMRTKEGSSDYRYFPEPDLVPVAPTDEMRGRGARRRCPSCRRARRARLQSTSGGSARPTRGCSSTHPGLADYAEAAVGRARRRHARSDVVNWAQRRRARLPQRDRAVAGGAAARARRARRARRPRRRRARSRAARPRTCSPSACSEPKRPKQVVDERGLAQVSDEGELGAVVDQVLAANADAVDEYRAGDDKVRKKKRGFLMGEVMQALRGPGQPPGRQPAPRPEARRRITVTPHRFHCRMDDARACSNRAVNPPTRESPDRRRAVRRVLASAGTRCRVQRTPDTAAGRPGGVGTIRPAACTGSSASPATRAAVGDGGRAVGRRRVRSSRTARPVCCGESTACRASRGRSSGCRRRSNPTSTGRHVHRGTRLDRADRDMLGPIPITTPVAHAHRSVARAWRTIACSHAMERPFGADLVTPERLAARLDALRKSGSTGCRPARPSSSPAAAGTRRSSRRWRRRCGCCCSVRGVAAAAPPDTGSSLPGGRYRLDFAWPERQRRRSSATVGSTTAAKSAFGTDRARLAEFGAARWRVLPVTWTACTRQPERVERWLRERARDSPP